MACAACNGDDRYWEEGPRTWVYDLPARTRTGDLILFSSKHSASNITKFFTGSDWDHIGMVLAPNVNRHFILEWGGGLFVTEMVERLNEYFHLDGRVIAIRHLRLPKEKRLAIERKIFAFADKLLRNDLGMNAGVPLKQVLGAVRRQFSPNAMAEPVVDDLNELFCSKTVAVCYKAAGIVAANRDAADFLPKHFASGYDNFTQLQGGALLLPEQAISFEPKEVRFAVQTMMSLPKTTAQSTVKALARGGDAIAAIVSTEDPKTAKALALDEAVALIQACARRWKARVELKKARGDACGRFLRWMHSGDARQHEARLDHLVELVAASAPRPEVFSRGPAHAQATR